MKELSALPDDIYALFNPDEDHVVNEENLESFAQNLKDLMRLRLRAAPEVRTPLRFSSLGKPNRQIWYDAHPIEGGVLPNGSPAKEALRPQTYVKFLYGDIIEQMLLFLTKEAGHTVEMEQAEVEVDGVLGHIDAKIDGVIVDVKSASPFGYQKFKKNEVVSDDPFGYVAQLSGYASVLTPSQPAAWLANDKVAGDICISILPSVVIDHHDPAERIKELKDVVESEEVPELCHQPVADGKSGNQKLGTACSYCSHKFRCHPSLRIFLYSTGPKFFTQILKEPKVDEITHLYSLSSSDGGSTELGT